MPLVTVKGKFHQIFMNHSFGWPRRADKWREMAISAKLGKKTHQRRLWVTPQRPWRDCLQVAPQQVGEPKAGATRRHCWRCLQLRCPSYLGTSALRWTWRCRLPRTSLLVAVPSPPGIPLVGAVSRGCGRPLAGVGVTRTGRQLVFTTAGVQWPYV